MVDLASLDQRLEYFSEYFWEVLKLPTDVKREVITMNQARQAEIFEQILVSYVEMCYSMSLVLTQNHEEARNLERHTLTWMCNLLDSEDGRTEIKRKLLKALPWLWEVLDNEDGKIEVKKKIIKILHTRCLQNDQLAQRSFRNELSLIG